ncbi:MAG TPA: hypothetical protein DHN29_05345 [Cytophagales bacterium]|nr:hypothetical protein [Cytophagales bacterium]
MSDFDGLVSDDKNFTSEVETVAEKSSKSSKSKEGSSLASSLGADDVASLTRKFDLDPELGEQVLVPLINFLDKYGVGDAVNDSPTMSGIMSLAEFWNDIAPVVKNAADYFGGRQQSLSDDDREFLERIRQAQEESADMSLFQDNGSNVSIGESVEETPPEPIEIVADPFTTDRPVDWFEMLGEPKQSGNHYETSSTIVDIIPQSEGFGPTGIAQLAAEAGLSVEEVMSKDGQNKINRSDNSKIGIDYLDPNFGDKIDMGADKISASIEQEKNKYERTSQAKFVDLPVPDSATNYDPLTVTGLELPALQGDGLESVAEMAAKVGMTEEDLKNQTALGGKSPVVTEEEAEIEVDNFEEVVLPEHPGELPPETFIVDFSDYETDE